MFEELTSFQTKLKDASLGEWVIDRENDGSPEHPIQFPFVAYNRTVTEFEETVYRFIDQHKEMNLTQYGEILEMANIKWDYESMKNADVSSLDGQTVMAMIVGAIRADRFCEGALLGFFEDGSIVKWLSRLQEIDGGSSPAGSKKGQL